MFPLTRNAIPPNIRCSKTPEGFQKSA
jgi:hypothetical protein